jgi:uncharacterized membrane protein YhaH (DUF805 family)
MFNWYKKVVFENYANFSGRARRSEYWYYALMNLIFAVLAMVIDNVAGLNFGSLPYGWIYMAYGLAVLLPGLAVAVRRLHDVGKSGWFMFIILVPLIGAIWILVLLFTAGNHGENNYGADPKSSGEEINEIGTE